METEMIVIAVVLMTIVILPFVFMSRAAKSKRKDLLNNLNQLATGFEASLSKTNSYGNYAIGMDETTSRIFFFKKEEYSVVSKMIDLTQVKNCNVSKIVHYVKNVDTRNEVVDSVSLIFNQNDGTTEPFKLYDEVESLQLNGEIAVADEWRKIVNDHLTAVNVREIPLPVATKAAFELEIAV